jgi:hypothetical protein
MSPVEARGRGSHLVDDERAEVGRPSEAAEDRDSLDDTTEAEDRFDEA